MKFKLNYAGQKIILVLWTFCLLSSIQGQLQQPNNLPLPCPRALKIDSNYHFRNTLHFICLQSATLNNTLPRLEVIQYNTGQLIWVQPIDELGVNQMVSFVDNEGTLRILLSIPNRINGTSMYSVASDGNYIPETHTINTQFVSSMSIWKLELNGQFQLAIANQASYEVYVPAQVDSPNSLPSLAMLKRPLPEPRPIISFHSWRSTYFDSYQRLLLPHDGQVNKLEPMHVNGQEFLIVAMESNRLDSMKNLKRCESFVYKLNFADGNLEWSLFQALNSITLASDVKSFQMTHKGSMQTDYYFAVLGNYAAPSNGRLGQNQRASEHAPHAGKYGLIIYKYMGDRFMLTHFNSASGATKLDAISYGQGDSYVIVALLSGWSNQIDLYLFNGLNLRPMPSPVPPRGANLMMRQRRTQASSSPTAQLHLFMVPPEQAAVNDSSANQRRTLSSPEMPETPMPAMAFSRYATYESGGDGSNSNDTDDEDSNVIYKIPVAQMIVDDKKLSDESLSATAGENSGTNQKRTFDAGRDLLSWCKSTINSLLNDQFNQQARQLMSLPKVDQPRPIELNGDLVIESNLMVSNLLYTSQVAEIRNFENRSGSELFIRDQPAMNFSQTFDRLQMIHQDIDLVKRQADSILVDDGSEQNVFQPLAFENLVLECPMGPDLRQPPNNPLLFYANNQQMRCPYINEIRTERLNSRNITNIQHQALLTGRSMVIASDVRFEHLILQGSVEILDTLNDLQINNIVFKNEGFKRFKGPIVGHKMFKNGFFVGDNSRLIIDSWNGFKLDRNNYLTSSGVQYVDANLRLQHLILDAKPYGNNNNSAGLTPRIDRLNNLQLGAYLSQIALADAPNEFQVPLYFDELILDGPISFKHQSILSSVNLDELWLTTLFKHSNQNITAPMEFANTVRISYGGDILVDGLVNRIPFNANSIVLRNQNYQLPNPILIEGDLEVDQLYIDKALNLIQVHANPYNRKELSILYDGGDQFITGDKVFNEIHLGGESYIKGLINGHLNLTELNRLANNDDNTHRFSTIRLTGSDIKIAENVQVHIDSTINGFKANDLCSLANEVANGRHTNHYNLLRFDDSIEFKSLRCAAINGFNNLSRSFLTRSGDQKILGTLRLTDGVIFNTTVSIQSTLNNLNVQPLASAIKQVLNDSATGHRDFIGDLVIDDLITNRINDLQLSNVFYAKSDQPQLIRAPMIFDHLDIENVLQIDQDFRTNLFNGLNVTDILTNTMNYDERQIVYNHVEVETLQLLPQSNFITKNLNGFNLQKLYSDSVLIDVPQQILAPKTFRNSIDFNNRAHLRHGIDGLSAEELRFNLLLNSDELIDGDLVFNNDVIIKKELEILSGSINEIDVNLFVNSMLYEQRPNSNTGNSLRIYGNGSVRFNDVRLNNLIVAGTVQGLDISKEALLKNENLNGTYDSRLKQQPYINNNQNFLNYYNGPKSSFKVFSQYHRQNYTGDCYVHSCTKTTLQPQLISAGAYRPPTPTPQPPPTYFNSRPIQQGPPLLYPQPPLPMKLQRPLQNGTQFPQHPTINYIQQFYPNVQPKPAYNLINMSDIKFVWQPQWQQIIQPSFNSITLPPNQNKLLEHQNYYHTLSDPKYIEYKAFKQAQAIKELALRVNKYLSTSFYYEIVQKQMLGPILNVAADPIVDEEGHPFLLFKTGDKPGAESCLQREQSIAVMARVRNQKKLSVFDQITLISETTNPTLVDSLVIGTDYHYLMVLDLYNPKKAVNEKQQVEVGSQEDDTLLAQIQVYLWDYTLGMYELVWKIPVDGYPTSMKVFKLHDVACIALANPNNILYRRNQTKIGSPVIYCQSKPLGNFDKLYNVQDLSGVFDLDVIQIAPKSSQILLAALSQQSGDQIGDLNVYALDLSTRQLTSLASRRLARPIKLHFFRNGFQAFPIELIVSEAITSNHNDEALTRVFSLSLTSGGGKAPSEYLKITANSTRLFEVQIIKDHEYYDIQSVKLNQFHSLLFLQSANFISIYGPTAAGSGSIVAPPAAPQCKQLGQHFSLIQRLPTKGANKFLVFNDYRSGRQNATMNPHQAYKHFLVLSRDDCEQHNYSTLILRAKFK